MLPGVCGEPAAQPLGVQLLVLAASWATCSADLQVCGRCSEEFPLLV